MDTELVTRDFHMAPGFTPPSSFDHPNSLDYKVHYEPYLLTCVDYQIPFDKMIEENLGLSMIKVNGSSETEFFMKFSKIQ